LPAGGSELVGLPRIPSAIDSKPEALSRTCGQAGSSIQNLLRVGRRKMDAVLSSPRTKGMVESRSWTA
jgi:hypothetical protein